MSGGTGVPGRLVVLAALSAGAGAVHFAAMGEHFALDWRHGVFFAVAGWAQVLWAAVVLLRPARSVLLAGIVGNAAIVALWGVSRTLGVPFGPGAGRPEPVGAPDVLATALEIVLVCCALALLDRAARQAVPSRSRRIGAGVVAGLVVVAVGTVFLPVFGSHGHAVPANPGDTTAAGGHQHGTGQGQNTSTDQGQSTGTQSGTDPSTATQSGTDPSTGTQSGTNPSSGTGQPDAGGHKHGDQGPVVPPSEGERAAADLAVAAAKRELPKRWPTLAAATKAGFAESIDTGGVVHLTKMAWIMDDRVLDPTRPEALVYYRKPSGGSILLGAMYIMPPGAQGPRIGGSLTHWHAHDDLCGLPGGGVAVLNPDGTCPKGTAKLPSTPEMLHVWVVDYPEGPFGDATAPALRTAITTLLSQGA
ncbi:hypothetical protein [Nonomuraea endophytica]|uniref:hypothetical protein n=1 Tax=Nonomuraea endophytica TaxID=714136 RepID=UPI0037C58711